MRNNKYILSIIICACCLAFYILPINVYTQSSNAATQTTVSLPPLMGQGPVPGGVISGYVFDEGGKPVSGAVVTLLQNGQVWQPVNYDFQGCTNPQKTNIAYSNTYGYLKEGSFEFGFLYPDKYTLMVEKDGYKSNSTDILIGNDTMRQTILDSEPPHTIVNITLVRYHVPTLTQGQLSYSGSISGTLRNAIGTGIPATNVSLWQDGQMINREDNPQSSFERNFSGKSVDYLFEHVAPGRYTVRAECSYSRLFIENVSVDVGTDAVRADIVFSDLVPSQPSWPPDQINSSASPSTESKPTPALPWIVVILVIGFIACFLYDKYKG